MARAARLLPLPLLFSIAALTWIKVARPAADTERTVLWLGLIPLALFAGGVLESWFRRQPRHRGAILLDRAHGLHDRVTNALTFAELPARERTPLMDAAIDDALATVTDVAPRRAAPLRIPRELAFSAALLVALAGILLLEVRTTRVLPPERHFDPLEMSADDLELFRDLAAELERQAQDPEAAAAVRRFNQLIEDIAARRLDRTEVFQRMAELDRELARGEQADKEALEAGLARIAEELEKAGLSRAVSAALKQRNLADAEKAMRELAEALKNKKQAPSKAELEQLRAAIQKASQASQAALKRIESQRQKLEEERKSLLEKQQPDGGMNEQTRRLLKKKERELERLDREKDRAKRAERQLSKLDRELAQAAQDLMKEAGLSGEDLERAAEDINRMAREEMSDQEKEDLRKRLQELRELLRQQGKDGKERLERLRRFSQRARGQQGGGQQGEEQGGGQQRRGQGGERPGEGQGEAGGSQPGRGANGREIVLGRGSKSIPMPGMGGGESAGSSGGAGEKSGGSGASEGGKEPGTGHDDKLAGDKSELKGRTQDVTAAAADTGEGTASSQVIYGAAERGFVGRGYQKVYTGYQTVAEKVMDEEKIPPGYRFYVQRYFQLIRPRE